MAKDPAVLFYTQDFIAGTLTMSHEHRGMYITLLCLQHQKGVLSEKDMLSICGTYVKDVFEKFTKDKQGNYFNKRMKEEAEKRKAYSESRRKNREKSKKKEDVKNISVSYVQHMENENENVNLDDNKGESAKEFSDRVIATPVEDKSIMAAAWAYRQIADRFGEFYMPAIDFIKPIKEIDEKDKREIFNVLKFGLNHEFWSDKLVDSQSLQNHYRKVKAAYVNSKRKNQ